MATKHRPLGVRPDVVLDGEQLRALQALEEYDLAPVRNRLITKAILPPSWVDDAILEFRRYLALRVVASEPVTMLSRPIDEVWHTCLLFSRLYADLCERSFGHFIHHEPAAGGDPDVRAEWSEFEEAYRSLFGEPGRLWQMGRPAD